MGPKKDKGGKGGGDKGGKGGDKGGKGRDKINLMIKIRENDKLHKNFVKPQINFYLIIW